MAGKKAKDEGSVYVFQKKGGLQAMKGGLGRPRTILEGTDKDGREVIEDKGEYMGVKLPQSKEDITPKFDPEMGKWDFLGDEADLAGLVKAIKLRYWKGHPEEGKIITEADRRDSKDAFFDNPHWFENPLQMIGSNLVLDTRNNPTADFLLRCKLGNRFVGDASEDMNPIIAAGMRYEVIKSSTDTKKRVADANLEIELISSIAGLSLEMAKNISIIMGLIHSEGGQASDPDILKPNLLDAIKKTIKNPGDKKLFEGKSYQSFYAELKDKKTAEITKLANIRRGMLNNTIRYKEGVYNLKGKDLAGVNVFSKLVGHFAAKENTEDYTTLLDNI